MLKRFNSSVVTGTLSGVSNAAVTGTGIFLGMSEEKISNGTLSAYLVITAATASLTVKPSWQVSNDGTTYHTVAQDTLNSLTLAVVTGTANVTRSVPAPPSVYGYQWAKCLLNIAGATGAGTDLYSIGYSYKIP